MVIVRLRQVGGDKGVQAVGHDRDREHDHQQVIQVGQRVVLEHLAGDVGVSLGFEQFPAAFADPHQQGDRGGGHVQPGGEALDVNDRYAGHHADNVEAGEQKYVEDARYA